MVYHPHVHFVVPGGGVKTDENGNGLSWQSTPKNFLFHHGTLIRVYKAKMADELRAAGLYDRVAAEVWDKKFVVDIQAVGLGVPTLKYLAPYVHRIAISDKRIVSVDESSETYRYTPSKSRSKKPQQKAAAKSRSTKPRTIQGDQFAEGFAQHVPRGFQKIRHYG